MFHSSADAELSESLAFSADSAPPDCSRSRVEGRSSVRVRMRRGGCSGRQADSGRTGEAGCCAADVEGSIGAAEAAAAACPTAQSGASCACVACASVHTSGGRELRRVRVASRRVGLVDVLWHGFHQSPSRRPEQRGRLQWPVRRHLCGGGATTAAETARWRRVGTRVDWSCNRRCIRSGFCTLFLPLRGSGQRCLRNILVLHFRLSLPSHLQSASVVSGKKVHPNVSKLTCERAGMASATCSKRLEATQ